MAEQQAISLQSNRMVVLACQFMSQGCKITGGTEEVIDTILVKHVFKKLKSSYERIREFKSVMAEKMLRSALLALQRASQRQKQIRLIIVKHFRSK